MCRCGNVILEKPHKFDFVGFFVSILKELQKLKF